MLRAAVALGLGVSAGAAWGRRTTSASTPISHENVVQCSSAATPASSGSRGVGGKCAFSPSEFQGFRLMSSKFESHDTRRFIFALKQPDDAMNLPVSSCILVKFTDPETGKDVVRPYTPISTNAQKGHFELLVKRYPKGKMGTHIFSMRPGEELQIKGPFVKFDYKPNTKKHIGMICGGTGITPMYQVIREVVDNPSDKTKLSLIYANNSRKDILLGNELCELQKTYPNFHMYLTLVEPPRRWLGGVGFITKEVLQAFLPKPKEAGTAVFVCGPPGMMKHISGDKDFSGGGSPKQGELSGLLKELGYTPEQVYKF